MQEVYDVAVAGAGAAGLVTALAASRSGPLKVVLIDAREKPGAKILMSGGTRCNVTNERVTPADFFTETPRTVRNILNAYPPAKTKDFFEELGVPLVLEEGGKYFPYSHSGRTVLEALLNAVRQVGITLAAGRKITQVRSQDGFFHSGGENFEYISRTLVLCTGGLSYPSTGSDGTGYQIAEALGHRLIARSPALTPLLTADPDWHGLSGLTLECRLELWSAGRKTAEFTDSFLFTHKGFSGPAALNISRHWLRCAESGRVLRASFLPRRDENQFRAQLSAAAEQDPKKSVKRFLGTEMPERLSEVLVKKSGLENSILNQLSRSGREALIRSVFYMPLAVSGCTGYSKAEVTAGGVDLAEVDSHTLESKKIPGLFFAGEILDADGRIGGFNFQWAWASGHAAGSAAARKALCGPSEGNV